MKLGIMQPYFLPYIGYFQLMKAVDLFVYYDDVTYIKQGWINRNNISLNGANYRFTLQLKGASSYKKISEIEVGNNSEKLFRTFSQAYAKAPYYKDAEELLYNIFHSVEKNLFYYILDAHSHIFNYLDIDINYIISSCFKKDCSLHGQDKVLDICKRQQATTYINAIGGQHLYSRRDFAKQGIELLFLHSSEDLPKKSIIDVIMNYSKEEIKLMFENYKYD